jgi:hypothetical protein
LKLTVRITLKKNKNKKTKKGRTYLSEMGLIFLRFSEQQVRKDMDFVLKAIEAYISKYEKLILSGGNRIINAGTFDMTSLPLWE